jgi:hypothetical protein
MSRFLAPFDKIRVLQHDMLAFITFGDRAFSNSHFGGVKR